MAGFDVLVQWQGFVPLSLSGMNYTLNRPLLDGTFDTLFRAPDRPFAQGDTVRQCGATVRVAAVQDGKPARLEIEFATALDAPDLMLWQWQGEHLERFSPPAAGEAVDVPFRPGPSGVL